MLWWPIWPGGPAGIEAGSREPAACFKPRISFEWFLWVRVRVLDSYSVHALKLALRYFNHMQGCDQ
jgi:hypothetical protein